MCGVVTKDEPYTYTTEAGRTYSMDNPDDAKVLQDAFGSVYNPYNGINRKVFGGRPGSSALWRYAGQGSVEAMKVLSHFNKGNFLDSAISSIVDTQSVESVGQGQTLSTASTVGGVSDDLPNVTMGNQENIATSGAGAPIGMVGRKPILSGANNRRLNTLG